MILTEEQQLELISLCNKMKELMDANNILMAESKEMLNKNTEVLRQANEDINVLLAFIKSKGLQPPKLQSKFTN